MNALGLDYGKKFVGVAYAQERIAEALTVFSTNEAITRIKQLAQNMPVNVCVIGIPERYLSQKAKEFGQKISQTLTCPIIFWDETLTTSAARQTLIANNNSPKNRKTQEHAVAAALILQSYLDQQSTV